MIVCPQPVAAEAGRAVLRAGGNAVDAVVTTALVQGVIDPMMCGIGGSGVMLVHLASGGQEVIEFYARAGEGVRADQWEHLFLRETADRYGYVLEGFVNDCGYQSVGVPGTVAGLAEALRRHGTISWAEAIGPGLEEARRGMRVTGNVRSYWITDYGPDVVRGDRRIAWTPESRRIYTRDGELYALGERISNPDLASTYERLAAVGPEDFYRGEIARAIAADFAAQGGFISASDLAAYRPRVVEPVAGSYRGRRLVVPGPPAGGMTLLMMLNFLERFDLSAAGWPSPQAARRRVEAMAWAMAEREEHLADPLFATVPVAELTAKEYAQAAVAAAHDSPTTTHVCAVDDAGNAVSLTHTLGSSSGVVTPGLGFTWNNYLNCFDPRPGRVNSLEPGKTRVTMMVPTMVLGASGAPEVVIGAPGGTRIVNGVLQTLLNLVDHGMTPLEAVAAPRVDFQGETVQAEQRIPSDVLDELVSRGFQVNRRPVSYDTYFSRVQVIRVGADGTVVGASDPRGDGGIALTA
ncbi:MAG TPA: gamma-glutamyltransferase family protein [Candidatus Dormibacteraeota bacterium]|nr:gamma-glutamyltransferase family protein [Candidatus Dormibacteraeota bacterium]